MTINLYFYYYYHYYFDNLLLEIWEVILNQKLKAR